MGVLRAKKVAESINANKEAEGCLVWVDNEVMSELVDKIIALILSRHAPAIYLYTVLRTNLSSAVYKFFKSKIKSHLEPR